MLRVADARLHAKTDRTHKPNDECNDGARGVKTKNKLLGHSCDMKISWFQRKNYEMRKKIETTECNVRQARK